MPAGNSAMAQRLQRNTPVQVQSGFATIAAGFGHVAALKSDGSLWTWGSNSYGQLADGTTTNSLVPKKVGTGYTMVAAGGVNDPSGECCRRNFRCRPQLDR